MASLSWEGRSWSVILYLAVNSYTIKALIYRLFFPENIYLIPLALIFDFLYVMFCCYVDWDTDTHYVMYDSHTLTTDIWSWQCGVTQKWAMAYFSWATDTYTVFGELGWLNSVTLKLSWVTQDPLFVQGGYSNTQSACHITARSTHIYFTHICLKSLSETFGLLSIHVKLTLKSSEICICSYFNQVRRELL